MGSERGVAWTLVTGGCSDGKGVRIGSIPILAGWAASRTGADSLFRLTSRCTVLRLTDTPTAHSASRIAFSV